MDIEPKNLFIKGRSSSQTLGNLILKSHAKKTSSILSIEIFENGLIQNDQKQDKAKTIQFDFDLKYGFDKEKLEIKFERGKQTTTYVLGSISDLQNWRLILKGKINQRGFHQQFKPIKKIGKGNFASVYLAQKHQDGVNYAVKAFSKQAAYSQQNGKQCLIKQIQVMRCLNNSNTMKLFEVFQSQNSLYIIFELLSGGQLYDKVKAKYRFKPEQTFQIMYGILKGLRQMHSKGIMHRDLKPQNLLFRKQGQWDCVIADFGLAEFSNADPYLFVRCGTPGYVAPQVINIKDMKTKYSPICDIYSLGLIFHILLFGKSAFPGTTYNQVLSQNRAANITFVGQQYKRCSSQALDLLQKMLKKNPNERINVEQALQHKYFKGIESQNYQQYQYPIPSPKINPGCDSPLLTSANPQRRVQKIRKDSCVDFHMKQSNLLTGKTDQISQGKGSQNHKLSIVNMVSPIRKPKVSQFSNQHR